MAPRIALYWHNGRALGHTAESATLAHALVSELPDVSIAAVTGAAQGLDMLPSAVDVVKLPSFVNYDTPARTVTKSVLDMDVERLFATRGRIIDEFLAGFRPHLLVVNHLPRGAFDELVPALENRRAVSNLLTLRGILFDKEKTEAEYFSPEAVAWLRQHYPAVHVHNDPDVFRLEEAYDIPADVVARFLYTGYMPKRVLHSRGSARARLGVDEGDRLIVASLGGGQGAISLWHEIIEALRRTRERWDRAHLVAGPYLEPEARRELVAAVDQLAGATVEDYSVDLEAWMKAGDLVIAAAGMNTLSEIMATDANAIVLPRQFREAEQRMHAERLAARGLVRMIRRETLSAEALACEIESALTAPLASADKPRLDGAATAAAHVRELLRGIGNGSPL